MILSDVSKTAIATLRSHVIESRKKDVIIDDPLARICLDKLISLVPDDEKALLFERKLFPSLTSHIAIRTRNI
jgi:O-methyltransferase involved in polyketide biosynthesis